MIYKDLKQDDMLQQQFPNSQLLFCHFHVLKIKSTSRKYSNLNWMWIDQRTSNI